MLGHSLELAAPLAAALAREPAAEWSATLSAAAALLTIAIALLSLVEAALHSPLAARLAARGRPAEERGRLERLLGRAEGLSQSARFLRLAAALALALVLDALLEQHGSERWPAALQALLAALVLASAADLLGEALTGRANDFALRAVPIFAWLQLPVAAVTALIVWTRNALRRALGLRWRAPRTSPVVEELRAVVEEARVEEPLAPEQREIIANTVELRDRDAAAIMTPRTQVRAIEVGASARAAAELVAQHRVSRLPVYQETIDRVLGTVSARELVALAAAGRLESANLRELLHPALFVPETKLVSELLAELRASKQNLAIVLDEYGGTAGIVTMGDVLAEIVGELPDEFDADEPAHLRRSGPGTYEVLGETRVAEVNAELELGLPQDAGYETIAGFVLAELGHFPRRGEGFERRGHEFSVLEATDRRVLKVRVRRAHAEAGA